MILPLLGQRINRFECREHARAAKAIGTLASAGSGGARRSTLFGTDAPWGTGVGASHPTRLARQGGMKRPVLLALFAYLTACGASLVPAASVPVAGSTEAAAAPRPAWGPDATPRALVTEATPEPAYDLAADLAARTISLRAELGAKTRFDTVEGVFLLATPSGVVGSSSAVAKKALTAYFHGRFGRRPPRAVAVLLFDTPKRYEAFCEARWKTSCISPYGFYSSAERLVALDAGPGIGTLTHELVHPIVEADFPAAPDWLDEGLASLYEAFSFPREGEIRGAKNFRHRVLVAALRSDRGRERASLPALFALRDGEFRDERESLHYASARYFCQWMDSQDKLWPFYRAWRDGFAADPTGEKAFAATMGKSPADLDAAWVAWVGRL